MRRARSQAGFTLVETLVAMLIAGVILGATLNALQVFQSQNRYDILRNEAQDNARSAIDSLGRHLLNVIAPEIKKEFSAATLEEAGEYSLAFRAIDSENAAQNMRVRYCLNNESESNEVLWYQVKYWAAGEEPSPASAPSETACPDQTKGDWDSSSKLASYITNRKGGQKRPVFTYGPPGATSSTKITTVQPHLYLEVNPGKTPGETQQFTTINLRNANRSPVASCRAEEINGHALIDASASEDPDGLALKYRWQQNGLEMGTTAQRYETEETFKSGTKLEYTLEVSDPGGLKSSTTCSVTIK